jgi:hypothetical protein
MHSLQYISTLEIHFLLVENEFRQGTYTHHGGTENRDWAVTHKFYGTGYLLMLQHDVCPMGLLASQPHSWSSLHGGVKS